MNSIRVNLKDLLMYAGTTLVVFLIAFFLFSFTEDKKQADEAANGMMQTALVWYPITNPGTGCDQINLNQYTGATPPPSFIPSNNPLGCNDGPVCCARGYAPSDLQFDAANNRWVPKANALFTTINKTVN